MNIQATSGSANFSLKSVAASAGISQSSAAEEAKETASVTRAEAAKGDLQAIRKIASQQQQNPAPARVSPEGVGKAVDLSA